MIYVSDGNFVYLVEFNYRENIIAGSCSTNIIKDSNQEHDLISNSSLVAGFKCEGLLSEGKFLC